MPLRNLALTTVSNTAVIVAPGKNRKKVRILNPSANPIRVGGAGVTATTGIRLAQNESVELETNAAVYAIREGSSDGSATGVEMTKS